MRCFETHCNNNYILEYLVVVYQHCDEFSISALKSIIVQKVYSLQFSITYKLKDIIIAT